MEYLNRKFIVDNAIKGLVLFLGVIAFLFIVLGHKTERDGFVYCLYDNAEDIYLIPTFFFSYAEILVLFYIRNKKINDKSTHFISTIYSFIVSFMLYLNIYNGGYLRFSNFIFLLLVIELTYIILTYNENDIKKMLSKEIPFWRNKKSKKNDKIGNEDIIAYIKDEIKNGQINPDTIKIINKKRRMFRHPFSFKGRIRCLEYFISFFIYMLYSVFFNIHEPVGWLIFNIPALWFITAQGTKRCHDAGNSGWCQLIPFWILFLLFEEGDAETNKYGPNPKEKIKM